MNNPTDPMTTIVDPKLLGRLVQDAVDDRYGGNLSAAARAIGLKQPQLHRLARGKLRRTHMSTIERILRLVGRRHLSDISRALVSPSALISQRSYDAWIARSDEFFARMVRGIPRDVDAAERAARVAFERRTRLANIESELRMRFPDLWRTFDRAATGHRKLRVDLAISRALEPLLDWMETDRIERHWDEMTEKEQRRFVESALDRESIMLNRRTDLIRSQQIDSDDFVQLMLGDRHGPRFRFCM